mmetsp:Transcript_11388/g.27147  ORF Transcript_11388/g.27147 Transcript_11388/m.27147 type:complete len:998 (+) Transcript_11388:336-3329(+)
MTGDNDHLDDRPHNVAQCLLALGITPDIRDGLFADCDSMEDEFKVIKTLYRAKILEDHPDKGGDPAVFRKTRAAFYVIRDLKNNGSVASFLSVAGGGSNNDECNIDDMYDVFWEQFSKGATPSYEYYEEMAQESVPGYRVELAKSGRSKCDACKNGRSKLSAPAKWTDGTEPTGPNGKTKSTNGNSKSSTTETALVAVSEGPRRSSRTKKKPDILAMATVDKTTDPMCIPKGNIRIGSLDDQSGSYGRWNHLVCWRVPYRIWAGLTDMTDPQQVKQDLLLLEDVLFDGVSTLPEKELNLLISHIMDEKNRVKKRKSKKAIPNLEKLRKEAEAAKAAAAAVNAAEKKVATATNKRNRDEGPNDDGKIGDGATVVKKEGTEEDDEKPAAKKQKADDEPDVEPDVKFPDGDDDDEDLSDSERPGAYSVHDRANGILPAWHRMFAPSSGVSTASQDTETAIDDHDRYHHRSQPPPQGQTTSDHNDDNVLDAHSEHRPRQGPDSMENGNGERIGEEDIPRKNDTSTLLSRRRLIFLAAIGVILVVAVAIGVSVALQSKNDQSDDRGEDGANNSSMPSSSSTNSTSSIATSRKSQLIDLLVTNKLTPRSSFDDTSSPQSEAVSWLADTDPLKVSDTDQDVLFDRYALACFFFATNGLEDWTNQLNFLTEKSVCEWNARVETNNSIDDDGTLSVSLSTQTQGVICDDTQQVSEIRIDGNNLRGFIPAELSALSHLTKLQLTRNTYTAGDNELPLLANVAQVGKMTSLVQLNLSNNKLYGSIPDSFFDLMDLQELNLSGNSFTDTVDRRIGDLDALRSLNLAGNNLDGTIRIETLTNLETLVLDDLNDGGIVDVQTQIVPLTNLNKLSMKRVDTFQPFLSDLSGMSNLEVLDLEDTDLDGSIGTSFSALTSLRYLSVKRNFLSGSIVPESFGTLSNLEFLDLSGNSFVGSLPSFPSSLLELHIYDNQFSGSVDNLCPSSMTLQIELDCGNGLEIDCSCCVCHLFE